MWCWLATRWGGIVIPRVAEVVPTQIHRVVWLAAAVTDDKENLLQAIPQSQWLRSVLIGPDGTVRTDPELHVDANLHDGTEEQRRFVLDRHLPYPQHALVEPGRLSAFLALGVPTGYVAAADDRIIEPPVAWGFADRLPGCQRAEVPGGHDCMMTRPDEVAAALESMAT
jgi:pimeloyl-ACP methyl ester carboxylesterase